MHSLSHTQKMYHGNNEFKIIERRRRDLDFRLQTTFLSFFLLVISSYSSKPQFVMWIYFFLLMFYLEYNGKKSEHTNFHKPH